MRVRVIAAAGLAAFALSGCSFLNGNRFRIEGRAMEPTFCDGDVVSFKDFDGQLDRFQVVVLRFPLDPDRTFVHRVIGLPGETVRIEGPTVEINGEVIDDAQYILAPANYTYGPQLVPADSYFVLGDNRSNSFDSHAWGSASRDPSAAFVSERFIRGEIPANTRGSGQCGEPSG